MPLDAGGTHRLVVRAAIRIVDGLLQRGDARAELRNFGRVDGGAVVELTPDSTAALRTAIDLHHHATVFEPAGFLNSLLRATCPIRAMRAWINAAERDGERRRAVAAEAVASIREDCTSHKARQAMVRAMWEWADHAEVADVEGSRVRARQRAGLARPDTVVANQESARCPLSASTGEMLAALVAARLRSFDRWRRGG